MTSMPKTKIISQSVWIHYATHDTRLTHSHRKLRLAEDFEMLCLTPDFEMLRLTLYSVTMRQTCSTSLAM